MKFLAAFGSRKVKGAKPFQVPLSTFNRLAKEMDLSEQIEIFERENIYNGKFHGRYAMIAGRTVPCEGSRYLPRHTADGLRSIEGDFVFAKAGRHDTESPALRYMDLMVASVGIPVYTVTVRHVSWFATDRAILAGLGAGEISVVQPYSLYSCSAKDHFPIHRLSSGKKIALQFSGGIGSMVAASTLKAEGYTPDLIYFLDGNSDRARQVMLQARDLGLRLDMHKKPDPANALVEENQKTLENLPEVLTRLGIATVWGCKSGCHYVATGDASETEQAVGATNALLRACAPPRYHLEYLGPVQGKSKPELLRMAEKANLPLVRARSCETSPVYCGWCSKCMAWDDAFEEIGQKDPRSLL